MSFKSLFFKLTRQPEKYDEQVAKDHLQILAEAEKRFNNLVSGKPANDHHNRLRKGMTRLVDSDTGFYTSHLGYVAGVAVFAVGAAVTATPVVITATAVAGASLAADRLNGNHAKRKGQRDLERLIKVLNNTEKKQQKKHRQTKRQ